jgi:DNA mismatch repair ATPase MutS
MAAFSFHITRMHSLPLDADKTKKEWTTIKSIATNNNFPQHLLEKLNHQIQNKKGRTQNDKRCIKTWTTFVYHSPQIRKITNLLKNTNIGIAFRTTATIQHLIRPKTQIQTSKHKKVEYIKSGATRAVRRM